MRNVGEYQRGWRNYGQPFVTDTLSALIGRPVYIPAMKESTSWGAALLAGLNEGLYKNIDEIDRIMLSRETGTVSTKSSPELIRRYRGWQSILQDY